MRNGYIEEVLGRSPYGERGLKCQDRSAGYRRCQVALLTESVD